MKGRVGSECLCKCLTALVFDLMRVRLCTPTMRARLCVYLPVRDCVREWGANVCWYVCVYV